MPCYICGGRTNPDKPFRRYVTTGAGLTGPQNSFIRGMLYSNTKKWPQARFYYGLRTVCENCAVALDQAEVKATRRMWIYVALAIGVILLLINFA